jgi:hypothetical protein
VTGVEWVKWHDVNAGCAEDTPFWCWGALLAACAGSTPSPNKIDSIVHIVCVAPNKQS